MTLKKERANRTWSSTIRVSSSYNLMQGCASSLTEINDGLSSALTFPGRYTALRHAPHRLIWLDAPRASAYNIVMRARGREYCGSSARPVFSVPEEMMLSPNCPVYWRMSPVGFHEDYVEGWFWLLDEETLARLEEAEATVARVEEPEMKVMVAAIAATEFELYDEAIMLLETLREQQRRKKAPGGRIALILRALISVFDAMIARIPSDACSSAGMWARSQRARHQRELTGWLSGSSPSYYMTRHSSETVSSPNRRVSVAM